MKIGELFMELGFKADTMKLNDFVRSVGELNMASIISGGSLAELVNVSKQLLEGTSGLAQEMRFFTTETGMSSQEMKSWSQLAKQLGMDGRVVEDSLRHLQMAVTRTKFGEPDQGLLKAYSILNTYGKAGLDINQDYFTQIEKMRDGMQKLTPEARRLVVQYAGLNEQMINFLMMSKEDWSKRNIQPTLDNSQIQTMKELQANWTQIGQDVTIIGNKYATEIAPIVSGVATNLHAVLADFNNSPVLQTFATMIKGYGYMGDAANWMGEKIEKMGQSSNATSDAMNQKYAAQQSILNNITMHIKSDDPQTSGILVRKELQDLLNSTKYQGREQR